MKAELILLGKYRASARLYASTVGHSKPILTIKNPLQWVCLTFPTVSLFGMPFTPPATFEVHGRGVICCDCELGFWSQTHLSLKSGSAASCVILDKLQESFCFSAFFKESL